MAQVFFVNCIGYSAEVYSNKNLRIPMGLEKERFRAASASRVQPAQSASSELRGTNNEKKSEDLLERFLESSKRFDVIMFIVCFAIFTLSGRERGFQDIGYAVSFITGVAVASLYAAFFIAGIMASISFARYPIQVILKKLIKFFKIIFMPTRYVLFDGIQVRNNTKAFLETEKKLIESNPNTIIIVVTNNPEVKINLEKYRLPISKKLIVKLLDDEEFLMFQADLQNDSVAKRDGPFIVIINRTENELGVLHNNMLDLSRLSSQAL